MDATTAGARSSAHAAAPSNNSTNAAVQDSAGFLWIATWEGLARYDGYEVRAYRTDPESAFGGIIAFNQALDTETAAAIIERQFVEVIIAPGIGDEALPRTFGVDNYAALARLLRRTRPAGGQSGRLSGCHLQDV